MSTVKISEKLQNELETELKEVIASPSLEKGAENLAGYMSKVYEYWKTSQSRITRFFSRSSKGRTKMMFAVRQFQKSKISFLNMLAELKEGWRSTESNLRKYLGDETHINQGLSKMAELHRKTCVKEFNGWITEQAKDKTIWKGELSEIGIALVESKNKNRLCNFLLPTTMEMWGEESDKSAEINPTDDLSRLSEDYQGWLEDLPKLIEKDNTEQSTVNEIQKLKKGWQPGAQDDKTNLEEDPEGNSIEINEKKPEVKKRGAAARKQKNEEDKENASDDKKICKTLGKNQLGWQKQTQKFISEGLESCVHAVEVRFRDKMEKALGKARKYFL